MKKLLQVFLSFSILGTGCAPRATPEGYRLLMNTWVNRPTDELFMNWGSPTNMIPLSDGGQILEYVKVWQSVTNPSTYVLPVPNNGSGTVNVGSQSASYNTYNTQYVPVSVPGSVENYRCTTRFKVGANKMIVQATWDGNGCLSDYRPPTPVVAQKPGPGSVNSDTEESFKNPVNIALGRSPVKGSAKAKITIIEFADFQCPYSKRGNDTMDEILRDYPKDVKIVFKHFPLPFHKEAASAARAAWAAQRQGKFWEFREALFSNQNELGHDFYLAVAKQLKLDEARFKTDMGSEAARKQVQEDSEIGAKHSVLGTPGFFVNGVAVQGAYPASHFRSIIDRLLSDAP